MILAVLVAGLFALLIGYISLRRSGIYFSILTLAFAQMSYNLAYSVLTPITNGETGLQITRTDPRVIDTWLSGAELADPVDQPVRHADARLQRLLLLRGAADRRVLLHAAHHPLAVRHDAARHQVEPEPSQLHRRVLAPVRTRRVRHLGAFAGLAGSLLAVTDPLAGAERMQWTASGEVVLMTILGGVGTLLGPVLGAVIIKYFENIFSSFNAQTLHAFFDFLPEPLEDVAVTVAGLFVGEAGT